jgi:hypothetical protein
MDQKEEETLSFEVSDEVLESAAATEMATPFTLGSCTGLMNPGDLLREVDLHCGVPTYEKLGLGLIGRDRTAHSSGKVAFFHPSSQSPPC